MQVGHGRARIGRGEVGDGTGVRNPAEPVGASACFGYLAAKGFYLLLGGSSEKTGARQPATLAEARET